MNVPFEDESIDFSHDSFDTNRISSGSDSPTIEELTLLADELFVHGLLQSYPTQDEAHIRENLDNAFIAIEQAATHPSRTAIQIPLVRRLWLVTISTGIAATLLWMLIFFESDHANAGLVTLDRIIEASRVKLDRTYRILVAYEYDSIRRPRNDPSSDQRAARSPHDQRPPKPTLNNAILHVRDGGQFVLIRNEVDGQPFITGSNGQTSWAVRAEGPVKVSKDVNRFNRDLPGHESSIPLTNIHERLEHLRKAYKVQLAAIDRVDPEVPNSDSLQTLIATRKPKERGPKRVEIAFDSRSGQIQHMRFIEMPYGPARLDLYMTLIEETQLSPDFFHHQSHHSPDRIVEIEE